MHILAHRANWKGASPYQENTLSAARYCFEQGWGIETDIRRAQDRRFYFSHDPSELMKANHADAFCSLFRQFPDAIIALNIKELDYESDLLHYLSEQMVLNQVFLFDMELLETRIGQTSQLFRRLSSNIKLAARVSDRGEPIDRALSIESADIIWLDEFDGLWITEEDILHLKSADKKIYAISPELHGFSRMDMKKRWFEFYTWGVDGICTDYAEHLAKKLASNFTS